MGFNFAINSVRDHGKILGFLRQKDEENCEKEMILHLNKLEEYLMHFDEALIAPEEVFNHAKRSRAGGVMRNILLDSAWQNR